MDQKSAATAIAMDPARAERTILIVEDSPVQAELLRRALEGAGYRVIAARDGAEGLAMAKANHPDAVVSDINMPVMDGYAMCQAIRGDESMKTNPVILLTILSGPDDVIRGLNAGADAYLTKPYNISALVHRIESLLIYPPVPPLASERRKIEVQVAGKTHLIEAHSQRMANLLISTYENAVLQNRELAETRNALEDLNQHLEQRVLEKTEELRKSGQRFRALLEHASDLVAITDANGTITYISPSIKRISGYEVGEILGKNYIGLVHADDAPAAAASYAEIIRAPGVLHKTEFRFRNYDGGWTVLESVATNARADPAINGIVINARDVTERKRTERELKRLNWALRALGQSSAGLIHAVTEKELFQSSCDAIAGTEVYPLALIGLAQDDAAHSVVIAAASGRAIEYLQGFEVSWADEALGWGPTGTAFRTGQTQVNNNLAESAAFLPWIEKARASGLASSIVLPFCIDGGAMGALIVYARETDAFGQSEVVLFEQLAADIGYGLASRRTGIAYEAGLVERVQATHKLRAAFESLIAVLAATVERRDPYTAGHQRRVADLASAIARDLGLDPACIEGLHFAATIHDIGKIYVPAEILARPGKLAAMEFELIKLHAQVGFEIVKDVEFPWPVADMIRQHHERLDGSGYPQGLKGDQIRLESRILAVADMVEAMSSHRPYRAGLGSDAALAQIRREAGTKLDRKVVDACERLFREQGFAFCKV